MFGVYVRVQKIPQMIKRKLTIGNFPKGPYKSISYENAVKNPKLVKSFKDPTHNQKRKAS